MLLNDAKNLEIINRIKKKLNFPVVVKPLNEGSSVNVYICTKKNIIKVLNSLKNYKKVMIEEFIAGREIQVAIMGNQKLGAIELKPKRENKNTVKEIVETVFILMPRPLLIKLLFAFSYS